MCGGHWWLIGVPVWRCCGQVRNSLKQAIKHLKRGSLLNFVDGIGRTLTASKNHTKETGEQAIALLRQVSVAISSGSSSGSDHVLSNLSRMLGIDQEDIVLIVKPPDVTNYADDVGDSCLKVRAA